MDCCGPRSIPNSSALPNDPGIGRPLVSIAWAIRPAGRLLIELPISAEAALAVHPVCTGPSNTWYQHQNYQVPRNVPQEWHSEIVVSVVVTNL
jgi:hypothetical protein